MDQPWACKGVAPGEDHKVITDITYFEDLDEWNAGYIKKMRKIMKYGPANIISDPQYFIQGLAGALPECYCREGVMLRLVRAAEMLPDGYKFVVFDGWRALKLQKSFYDEQRRRLAAADPSLNEETLDRMTVEFVSLPSRSDLHPAPHSTGGALDLSVADENGLLLPMGTKFDSDTAEASTSYYEERLAAGDALSESDIAAMEIINNADGLTDGQKITLES